MKRSQWGVGAVLVGMAVLLAASPGSSQAPGDGPNGKDRPAWTDRADRMHRGLDLTDEQRTQLEGIREKGDAARVELRKELARAEHALRGEFLQDDPDAKRVRQQVEQIGAIRTKLEVQRAEERLAFRKLLTPEQRDKLLAMRGRGDRGPRGEGWHRDGRPGGRGQGRGEGRGDRDRQRVHWPRPDAD